MTRRLGMGIALVAVLLLAGTAGAYPRAVLFTFDDSRASVYTTGYPIFANHGYNATFYVVTDEINDYYYQGKSTITLTQLKALYNAGWDIGDHTNNHREWINDTLDLSEQIAAIQGGKDDLNNWTLTRASSHLAYPGGKHDSNTTLAMTSVGMLTGRTVESAPLTIPPNDVFHLTGVRVLNNQTSEDGEDTYLLSLSSDNVVIYLTHGVDDPGAGASNTTNATLEHMLDYMSVHQIPVWTITQLYENISAPVTGFSANVTSGITPLAVRFTDSSTNTPTNWDWYWYANETKSSDVQNPTTSLTTGIYNVRLYTSNSAGGDWENKTAYIDVMSGIIAPVTGFSANVTSGTTPLAVRFTDSSTNTPTNWDWYWYANQTKSSDVQNPTTSLTTGIYNVRLYTSNSAGGDWENKTAYISVNQAVVTPVANFTATPRTGTGSLSVAFTDTSTNTPTSRIWAYKNATVGWTQFATTPTPSFIFAAGTYDINLTATNAGGSDDEVKTGYITVSNPTLLPDMIGVFRPSAHTFYLKNGTALSWTTTAINWGVSTDLPVTGDWNGDGITDVGVYRPSAQTFYLKNGTALSWTTTAINWGTGTDLPVTGKW